LARLHEQELAAILFGALDATNCRLAKCYLLLCQSVSFEEDKTDEEDRYTARYKGESHRQNSTPSKGDWSMPLYHIVIEKLPADPTSEECFSYECRHDIQAFDYARLKCELHGRLSRIKEIRVALANTAPATHTSSR